MKADLVTEARAMLDTMDSEWPDEARELTCRCSLCVFDNAAPRLVRGLLAEVERLRAELAVTAAGPLRCEDWQRPPRDASEFACLRCGVDILFYRHVEGMPRGFASASLSLHPSLGGTLRPLSATWVWVPGVYGAGGTMRVTMKVWQCIHCDVVNFGPTIDLEHVWCRCGRGAGRWCLSSVEDSGLIRNTLAPLPEPKSR